MCKIKGYIEDAEYTYQKKAYVYPIPRYYNEPNEEDYIKFSCPVCEHLGHRFQPTRFEPRCDLCGVNFSWNLPEGVYE